MKRVTAAIRMRALRGAILMLGRSMTACSRGLLKASASLPNIDVLAEDRIVVQNPNVAVERLLVLQLLDRQIPCSRSELEAALKTIEPLAVNDALSALFEKGRRLHLSGASVGHPMPPAPGRTRPHHRMSKSWRFP